MFIEQVVMLEVCIEEVIGQFDDLCIVKFEVECVCDDVQCELYNVYCCQFELVGQLQSYCGKVEIVCVCVEKVVGELLMLIE